MPYQCMLLLWISYLILATLQADLSGPFVWRVGDRSHEGTCIPGVEIALLDPAWTEAQGIAKIARTALKLVNVGKANWDEGTDAYRISRALKAIFGIRTSKRLRSISKEDQTRLNDIIDVFNNILLLDEDEPVDKKIRLYCNDDWMQWKTKDPKTGQPWPNLPGQWFLPDFDAYYAGSFDGQPCLDSDNTAAFVINRAGAGVRQISWCPATFIGFPPRPPSQERYHYKPNLRAEKADQAGTIKPGSHISGLDSVPGAWIHELAHLTREDISDQIAVDKNKKPLQGKAYGFDRCALLANANPDAAVHNADNYQQFAIAMYFEYFDWADGFAKPFRYKKSDVALNVTDGHDEQIILTRGQGATATTTIKGTPTITDGAYIDKEVALDPVEERMVASMIDEMLATEVETPTFQNVEATANAQEL